MARLSFKSAIWLALACIVIVGPANAAQFRFGNLAQLVIPIQDEENEEVWKDLRPDVTPPEAAVGNDGEAARNWETAANKEDCEKVGGVWEASSNKCVKKK